MNKRVRLPGGKWITVVLPESKSHELQAAAPEEIWECGDGRKILVKDMDIRHITNVIKLLRFRAQNALVKINSTMALNEDSVSAYAASAFPIYVRLHAEFELRVKQTAALKSLPMSKAEQLSLDNPPESKPSRVFSFED